MSSSYTHEEYTLALKKIASLSGKTFWLSTEADGTMDWGYHDDSTPPTQAEIEAEISSAVEEENWNEVRRKRNNKLYNSDWTQSSDSPLSDAKKTEWATYRQALRDLPASENPNEFPTPPSA